MQTSTLYHQTEERLNEEQEQVKKAQEDPARFEPLYRKYHEQIFRFIYQRMDDKDAAFDITSQVFLKAITNLKKYQFKGVPFSSWLYTIALNEIRKYFRDNASKRTINIEDQHVESIKDELAKDEAELQFKEQAMIDGLAQLDEENLELVEMRYIEGLSFKQIGEVLEITENNAKVRLYRAMDKLKALIN